MRLSQLLARPWVLCTIAGILALAAMETIAGTGVRGFATATIGSLFGVILLPFTTQLGLLLGSAVFGLRVRHVVFGAMRALGSRQIGNTTWTVRALPVVLRSEIGPWRSPVILRCWLAGLLSALAGVALVVGTWFLIVMPFWRGFVLAATPLLVYKLWPRRAPLATSTGWLLFGLPRMPQSERAEFEAGPLASSAYEALRRGELETAQARTDELAAAHPDLNAAVSCRVTMFEARGDYASAVMTLLQHISSGKIGAREMSYTLAGLAGLGFSAVEAQQLPADEIMPVARKALDDAIALGFPSFDLSGTRGLLALLEGDADEAVRLAELGAEHATSPLSRADDLATLARAHMARLDNATAREALAEAERAAAWWPRVRNTRERLSVS